MTQTSETKTCTGRDEALHSLTSYEMLNRERRASKLSAIMRQMEITPAQARHINDDGWVSAAKQAGVNVPVSAATRNLTISMLELGV